MKTFFARGCLFCLNGVLLLTLVWGLNTRSKSRTLRDTDSSVPAEVDSAQNLTSARDPPITPPSKPLARVETRTPFTAVYSRDPGQFAANLRRVGCPENTINDIVVADVNRRYRAREEALRPTPADHVPWGWSPRTSEGKLIERRLQAAAITREKGATLRAALGFEVPVRMPAYAMTTSDQSFERAVEALAPAQRAAARAVQDNYWAGVGELYALTAGFWQSEDVAELKRLQEERNLALEQLMASP